MELPWSNYLYAVATLAMTFIGFCAIVISLHQTRDGRSPNMKILRQHTRGYIELGFSAVGAAMLAPMLAACGLSASLAWRWSSVIIAVGLTVHVCFVLRRWFFVLAKGQVPMRIWVNQALTGLVVLGLLANSIGFLIEPSAGPVVVAATWRLVMAAAVFFLTYEDFLESA